MQTLLPNSPSLGNSGFAVPAVKGLLWLAFSLSLALAQSGEVRPVPAPGPAAAILPPPSDYHFPNRTTYVYNVEWHLFNAGTALVTMQTAGADERITAAADSSGVVNALFRVHDQLEARFDPHTFCSLQVSRHIEEGSRQRQTDLRLDYQRHRSVLDERNLKTGESKHAENDLPSCATDMLSAFYYLASLPLKPGNTSTFLLNNGKTTEVRAQVEEREKAKVPAGSFPTVRLRIEAISGPLAGKGVVWIWYSDDGLHVPVRIRSKLGWGTLLFELVRADRQPG
jgi:hypothetical protein